MTPHTHAETSPKISTCAQTTDSFGLCSNAGLRGCVKTPSLYGTKKFGRSSRATLGYVNARNHRDPSTDVRATVPTYGQATTKSQFRVQLTQARRT